MARIEPLRKEEAHGETRAVYEAIKGQFGMIPNLFGTIAQYPKALKPIIDLYGAIAGESDIDMKLQELANLEVSRINGCEYCLAHHTQMAKMSGLSDGQLSAWRAGMSDGILSDKEKAVIEYAGAVTKDAEHVPDELFSRIKSYFSESEIVNLTLIIGLMNVFNRFNGALEVDLEG